MEGSCCHGAAVTGPLSLALLFTTGLLMSFGHCLGMCGPIVGAFSMAQRGRGASPAGFGVAAGLYQGGRLISYVVIGAAFGALGVGAAKVGFAGAVKGWFSIVAAAAMLMLGLGLLGILPAQTLFDRLPPVRRVTRTIQRLLTTSKPGGHLLLGVANGLLPCGPVAAAAMAAAATTNPTRGMLAMLAYGLGTVPALLALSFGMSTLQPAARTRLYRLGAVLILLIAFQLGMRGLHGLGWVEPFQLGEVVFW